MIGISVVRSYVLRRAFNRVLVRAARELTQSGAAHV